MIVTWYEVDHSRHGWPSVHRRGHVSGYEWVNGVLNYEVDCDDHEVRLVDTIIVTRVTPAP